MVNNRITLFTENESDTRAESWLMGRTTTCKTVVEWDSNPMGAGLSVEENAYSQLSKELKGQRGDYEQCLRSFIDVVDDFDVLSFLVIVIM